MFIRGASLLVIITSHCQVWSQVDSVANAANVHSQFRCVTERNYRSHDNETVCKAGESYKHSCHVFDDAGNEVSLSHFDKDWKPLSTYWYTYINDFKTEMRVLGPDSNIRSRTVYIYDTAGLLSSIVFYKARGIVQSYVQDLTKKFKLPGKRIYYDPAGKVTNTEYLDASDSLIRKEESKQRTANAENDTGINFDSLTRIKTTHAYNKDGTVRGEYVHHYNLEGKEVELDFYDNSIRENTIVVLNHYDNNGNLALTTRSKGGNLGKTEYRYYPDGIKAEETTYGWSRGYYLREHEQYNTCGKLLRSERYDKNGNYFSGIVNS